MKTPGMPMYTDSACRVNCKPVNLSSTSNEEAALKDVMVYTFTVYTVSKALYTKGISMNHSVNLTK